MKITVGELARMVNGKVLGDESLEITGFAPISEAKDGAVTFLTNPKYNHFLYESDATAVLVNDDFQAEAVVKPALIFVKDAYTTVSTLLAKFSGQADHKTGIEQPSFISSTAKYGEGLYFGAFAYLGENCEIGENVKIYPQVYIGDNVFIDDNTIIYPGVKIYRGSTIGKNCIFHSGCVVGSDGFGFAPQANGSYTKIPQTGIVIIKDNVEIGANTTIDRATMQATIIESGVKLDNLIQVAHNVEIGENTAIAAQTGISGSTKIGKGCIIAGQVGIVGHINIADGSQIGAQSGISKTIKLPKQKWFGSPADDYRTALKSHSMVKQLPDLQKRIIELERIIKSK
jgi:UDP-3-O-[3-hydroxymyristoyl] glucosamine N-acyltransferase